MRFLADENIEPAMVHWPRCQAYDVLSFRETARGSDDDDLLARAVADDRVVVTYDRDFGELVHRRQLPHRGIVLLRLTAAGSADRLARLQAHWPVVASQCEGRFIVVHDDRVRIRAALDGPQP